jgi:hypothetical protein
LRGETVRHSNGAGTRRTKKSEIECTRRANELIRRASRIQGEAWKSTRCADIAKRMIFEKMLNYSWPQWPPSDADVDGDVCLR